MVCRSVLQFATMAPNVIICEPRTSNAQRWKKYQITENLSESIFQISPTTLYFKLMKVHVVDNKPVIN